MTFTGWDGIKKVRFLCGSRDGVSILIEVPFVSSETASVPQEDAVNCE